MRELVFEAGGLLHGSSAPALETFLRRQPSIHHAEASTMSQTVTVGYDETAITEAAIGRLIEACGYHCAGEVLPKHLCVPEPAVEHADYAVPAAHTGHALPAPAKPEVPAGEHAGHVMPTAGTAAGNGQVEQMAHEMGHGGSTNIEAMVRDMRNRFWITFVLGILVTLYSPLATEVFGLRLPAPFGIPVNILLFILSTPAVLWVGRCSSSAPTAR